MLGALAAFNEIANSSPSRINNLVKNGEHLFLFSISESPSGMTSFDEGDIEITTSHVAIDPNQAGESLVALGTEVAESSWLQDQANDLNGVSPYPFDSKGNPTFVNDLSFDQIAPSSLEAVRSMAQKEYRKRYLNVDDPSTTPPISEPDPPPVSGVTRGTGGGFNIPSRTPPAPAVPPLPKPPPPPPLKKPGQ